MRQQHRQPAGVDDRLRVLGPQRVQVGARVEERRHRPPPRRHRDAWLARHPTSVLRDLRSAPNKWRRATGPIDSAKHADRKIRAMVSITSQSVRCLSRQAHRGLAPRESEHSHERHHRNHRPTHHHATIATTPPHRHAVQLLRVGALSRRRRRRRDGARRRRRPRQRRVDGGGLASAPIRPSRSRSSASRSRRCCGPPSGS